MAAYRVLFRESVWKDLQSIPKKELQRILDRISALGNDPRPPGAEKLTGQDRYRIRQGRYRIIYSIQNQELTVWVVKVGVDKRDVSEITCDSDQSGSEKLNFTSVPPSPSVR